MLTCLAFSAGIAHSTGISSVDFEVQFVPVGHFLFNSNQEVETQSVYTETNGFTDYVTAFRRAGVCVQNSVRTGSCSQQIGRNITQDVSAYVPSTVEVVKASASIY